MVERSRVLGTFSDIENSSATTRFKRGFVAMPEASEERVMRRDLRAQRSASLGGSCRVSPLMASKVRLETLDSVRCDASRSSSELPSGWAAKRVSTSVSISILVLAAPLFGSPRFLTKRASPGPVFFEHAAHRQDGKPFRMLKFRTMQHARLEGLGVSAQGGRSPDHADRALAAGAQPRRLRSS